MSGVEATVVLAAVVAGLTGTWSPCGFSMIETIGPVGHTGGRATTVAACLTFTVGALAGGVLTFGLLSAIGSVLGGGDLAYLAAAAVAVVAAVAELRGVRILPQVRRQLPEHWRRGLPMPLAAAGYGVLLGLGFTTFVLTFGVFALAGIAVAVGDVGLGVAIGLAFGLGRALPVALVAPVADRDAGIRVTETMALRPGILRGFRIGDGVALLAVAAALVVAVPAGAARTAATPAADPSPGGSALAFQRPDGSGVLRGSGGHVALPGTDPALGDGRIAVIAGGQIRVLSAKDLSEVGRVRARGADAVAISRRWLVWRARRGGRDLMRARSLSNPQRPGPERSLGRSGKRGQLGRPSLDGNRLVYARATQIENAIVRRLLGSKRKKRAKSTLMRSRSAGLSNPSLRGGALLYVRHTKRADRLKLVAAGGRGSGRTLLARRSGTLWSTALTPKRAYVTLIHGSQPRQRILSVSR